MHGDEARVLEVFCLYLASHGWAVQREHQFCDVVATRAGRRLLAEAKGRTKNPGLDVDTLYGQLRAASLPTKTARSSSGW